MYRDVPGVVFAAPPVSLSVRPRIWRQNPICTTLRQKSQPQVPVRVNKHSTGFEARCVLKWIWIVQALAMHSTA